MTTLFLKTQKKLIGIFWWSQNWEPPNPKKVHINSLFEDIPIERKKFCTISVRSQKSYDITRFYSPQKTYKKFEFQSLKNEKIISSYAQLMYILKQSVPWDLRVLRQVTELPTLCTLENPSFLIKFLISSTKSHMSGDDINH